MKMYVLIMVFMANATAITPQNYGTTGTPFQARAQITSMQYEHIDNMSYDGCIRLRDDLRATYEGYVTSGAANTSRVTSKFECYPK